MDLRAHLTALRRSWWLVAVPAVVGLVLSVVVLGLQTPKYESTANVYVSVGNAANANDLSQGSSFAQQAAVNYAALAEQPYVLHAVRQKLGLTLTSDRIAKEMTTDVEQNTSIISITVLDPSAARAAAIANTTATQLSTAVGVLNPEASDGTQNVRVTVVRTAGVADAPTVPNRPLGLALGLLGGLLVGVLLVIARELLDTRVRTVEELQQLTGAPVVGQIPRTASITDHPLVLVEHRGGAAAEGFRLLQLNTEYLRAPGGVRVLGVASAVPSEGKSTVAANLAVALAAAGHRVALVDADLRRPRLHTVFGLDNGIGLTEVLIGRVDVMDAVQTWGSDGQRIAVVPAGATPPNPGELLQSPLLAQTLRRLADEADVVLVDGPPLLAVADSAVLARTVDAVLLVASLQRSHRSSLVRAVDALRNVGARVLGNVATMTKPARSESDAYSRYALAEPEKVERSRRRRALPAAEAAPVAEATEEGSLPSPRRDLLRRPHRAESAPAPLHGTADIPEAEREPAAEGVVERSEADALPADAGVIVLDDHRSARGLAAEADDDRRPPTPIELQVVHATSSDDGPVSEATLVEAEEPAVVEDEVLPASSEESDAALFVPDTDALPEQQTVYFVEDGVAEERVLESQAPQRGRPTRVPSAKEVDPKTLRALRRRLTPEELRVLRGFEARTSGTR